MEPVNIPVDLTMRGARGFAERTERKGENAEEVAECSAPQAKILHFAIMGGNL